MCGSEIDVLAERIARLERTNRHFKMAGVALALASTALVSMALGGKPRTIEAEKIVVHDSHHRARITIGTPEVVGAAVGMKQDEPGIWLNDESGADRTILSSDGLRFANGKARPIASLTAGPMRAQLQLYGPDGKVIWSAP